MTGIYKAMVWIMHFAYLQLLWICFTLLGLVFLGVFPATVSVFHVLRKWMLGKREIPIFKTFWQCYKKEFIQINIIGFIFVIVGFILYVDLKFFGFEDMLSGIARILVLLVVFLYIGTFIFLFPVCVHFNFKLFDYIKFSFLYSVSSPWITILIMLSTSVVLFLFYKIPGLAVFFFISIIGFLWMWGAFSVFHRKHKHSNIL